MIDRLEQLRRLFAEHDLGQGDVLVALGIYFGQTMQDRQSRTVVYMRDRQVALTLIYGSNGELTGLKHGPGLHADDLDNLIRLLDAPRPRRVMGVVIFSDVPTTGWWQFRDRFQLFPLPRQAPRPERVIGGVHPLMLEVAYEGSNDDRLDEYRGAVATREVNRLLSGLLRGTEDRLGHSARADWFLVADGASGGSDVLRPRFGAIGYPLGPAPKRRTADFSAVAKGVPPLEVSARADYYSKRGISSMELPDSIESALDSYLALARADQDRVLRWCHWLNHARQIGALSPSAAAIAAVQSVEALLPPASGTGRCESCGRGTGPSLGQQFKRFLAKYAPGNDNAAARDRLYQLRSKLTHGGSLLIGELREIAFHEFTPRSWGERELVEQALMAARLAGVNWLLGSATTGTES